MLSFIRTTDFAGYQMDRRVGNTKNLGAIFGVLAALGVPVPVPGSLGFKVAQALNGLRTKLTGELISSPWMQHNQC